MGKHWCYFFFMLWLTYLIVTSVLLFGKGFLLTRTAQKTNATCVPFDNIPCISSTSSECNDRTKLAPILRNFDSSICLPRKARVVVIIVDALRYDFTVFKPDNTHPLPYQNKLPTINKLKTEAPASTRLFKFIADPPTTTMQRLKGLTTGTLPTFIDVGSNFATPEINEDNLIDQVLRNNQAAVFMGDDTWNGLYPNRFLRKYPFPSFNVWDLDTVDDGIRANIYKELNESDWTLLVAHFLGVDHCGHRYGPNHPEMARKLTEIDGVIDKVAREIDDDTMIFVIGDHGMTTTGDHGGESEDEVTSALFVYTKQPLVEFNQSRVSVKQVDLVPTLATILGIPIPFSNLGTLILDALPVWIDDKNVEEWRPLVFSLWTNAKQMMTYFRDYSRTNLDTFSNQTVDEFNHKFSILNGKVRTISSKVQFDEFATEAASFLEDLRLSCEEVWVKFDSYAMTRGLLFLFVSMFFVYTITDGIPLEKLPEIFLSSFLLCSFSAVFFTGVLAVFLYHANLVSNLYGTIFLCTALISQFMLVILVVQNWELISLNWYDRSKKERLSNFITRLVLVFFLCSLFSNSFIIEEQFMLLFLLNTIILVGSSSVSPHETKKKVDVKSKMKLLSVAFGIAALVRFSVYFWRCREEQGWCFAFHNTLVSSKNETTKLQWAFAVICLGLFVTATKVWLRNCGNLNGYGLTVTLSKYVPTVLVVATSGFWVLNRLPASKSNPWQNNVLAWTVYGLGAFSVISTVLKPLSVYILPTENVKNGSGGTSIPQLFKHVKKLFDEPTKEEVPVICGLGTVYSAFYVTVGVYLTLIVALLQGDGTAPSSVIMFLTASFILIVTSIVRVEKAETIESLFKVPNMYILAWVVLSQYFFYGTGHQPSFPNIDWNSAFIGTTGLTTHNIVPATLIVINTFSSHILMGFLLPLLIIVPFTISVMIPSTVKKSVLQQGSARGEVMLYERDGLLLTAAFTTCCKYIMCQGIRVFASMLAATIHCRHLMVWNIFAPKLIFEALGMFVTLVVVNLTYLVLIRVNGKVDALISRLSKKYS